MSTTITASGITTAEIDSFNDEPASGVSWGAIFAGAAAAAALSLILLVLGTGLGFAEVSRASRDAAGIHFPDHEALRRLLSSRRIVVRAANHIAWRWLRVSRSHAWIDRSVLTGPALRSRRGR